MPQFQARPVRVQAFKHVLNQPIPPEFEDLSGMTATSGEIKIGRDPVGQLMVPVGGSMVICRIGDYVVQDDQGRLSVARGDDFERLYEPVEDAPAAEDAEPAA